MTSAFKAITGSDGRIPSSGIIRLASLGLVVITIVALGAVAFFTERDIVTSRDSVIQTYQVRSRLSELELEVLRLSGRDASSFSNSDKLEKSRQEAASAWQTTATLRKLTTDNSTQQARLSELQPLLSELVSLNQAQSRVSGTRIQASPEEKNVLEKLDDRQRRITAIVASMRDTEGVLLDQRLQSWEYLFRRNAWMLILAFAIVTVMLAYNFWLLISEIARTRDREDLMRANAESYRLMSAKILELQDVERRRIARELHDSVGQFLAGLKINLSQVDPHKENSKALVEETLRLTDYAIQEVRTISHLLHPPLLDELGFLSAARWYVDEYGRRSQLNVSLTIEEPIVRLPREVEIALFRVLQETLTNVYRHAAASSVHVRIICLDGRVHLTVADNGRGIPAEVLAQFHIGSAPGIGLAGMRERLAEFGGEMKVNSSSAGSVVEAIIPTDACARHPLSAFDDAA